MRHDHPDSYPYPSHRTPVFGENMAATSQPLASSAALRMLERGGNAVDAAVAAAAVLTVVEPTGCGLGSDAFCILWDGSSLHAFNGSGRSPKGLDPARFAGRAQMPEDGWDAVTVPGAVDAWAQVHRRFGRLAFADVLGPAVRYARHGFPVSPVIAAQWQSAPQTKTRQPGFAEMYLPGGGAPGAGERFASDNLARSLEAIARTEGETLYRGELAERIARAAAQQSGAITLDDLAEHRGFWCDTIQTAFAGCDVHEIPPNGQGVGALMALGILRSLPLADHPIDSAESVHLQIEAMKLALMDAYRHVADPDFMTVTTDWLLDEQRLAELADTIDPQRASDPDDTLRDGGGTVYLATADASGMMVSFIQSNFTGFGSGVVVPGTGVSLQSRARGFVTDPDHPNAVGPGKLPFHTIIPGFLMRGGRPQMAFGVMGGPFQTQGHVQVLTRMLVDGQNPQAAIDGPRWRVLPGNRVGVEAALDARIGDRLRAMGHRLEVMPPGAFGGAQLIWRDAGHYVGGSESRKDGQAVAF